jgi:hypothetical protein
VSAFQEGEWLSADGHALTAGYFRVGVLREARIENGIGNLVADFVCGEDE